jgi:hypothetical protein
MSGPRHISGRYSLLGLALVIASGAAGSLLQPIELVRAVTHVGSGAGLRGLVAKLEGGDAISVAVLGGSVSAGHGSRGDKYGELVLSFLQRRWPASNHTFTNGAVPATSSAHFAQCLRYAAKRASH